MLSSVMDAVVPRRNPPPRHASWRVGFLWLNVTVCLLCVAYVAVAMLALVFFGAQRLHDMLGETFYNSWVAGGGVVQSLMVIVPLLALDVLVGVACSLAGMLRTRAWRLPGAILVAGLLAGSVWCIRAAVVSPDPMADQLWGLVMGTDTAYASGYSEAGFRTIEPGMSRSEVLALIGPPLDAPGWFAGNSRHAFYAWSPTSTDFWRREVLYGVDDRVEGVIAELWYD